MLQDIEKKTSRSARLQHIDDITCYVYGYINMVKRHGPEQKSFFLKHANSERGWEAMGSRKVWAVFAWPSVLTVSL